MVSARLPSVLARSYQGTARSHHDPGHQGTGPWPPWSTGVSALGHPGTGPGPPHHETVKARRTATELARVEAQDPPGTIHDRPGMGSPRGQFRQRRELAYASDRLWRWPSLRPPGNATSWPTRSGKCRVGMPWRPQNSQHPELADALRHWMSRNSPEAPPAQRHELAHAHGKC